MMTEAEELELRRLVSRQQGFISQLRAEVRRLRTLRIRIVSGELADLVDVEKELGDERQFLIPATDTWIEILSRIRAAATTSADAGIALKALTGEQVAVVKSL
jgi:hypothetical protein